MLVWSEDTLLPNMEIDVFSKYRYSCAWEKCLGRSWKERGTFIFIFIFSKQKNPSPVCWAFSLLPCLSWGCTLLVTCDYTTWQKFSLLNHFQPQQSTLLRWVVAVTQAAPANMVGMLSSVWVQNQANNRHKKMRLVLPTSAETNHRLVVFSHILYKLASFFTVLLFYMYLFYSHA